MSKLNAGRKPISEKPTKPGAIQRPNFFKDRLTVSPELQKELADKGLDYRFISYKKFIADGNQHNNGWEIYRREKRDGAESLALGNSTDGIIRRADAVLAVRPKEHSQQHKDWLRHQAGVMSGFNKAKAVELRQLAREASGTINVHEGFEDDDGE